MLTQVLLRHLSDARAHAPAFHFRTFAPGEPTPRTQVLSFAELLRKAMGVARQLAALTRPGDRVLVTTDTGLPYHLGFFGCLLAGALPVPLPEPRTPAQLARCLAAAADSSARCALVGGERGLQTAAALSAAGLGSILVPVDIAPDEFLRKPGSSSDIAYLQYTSGSTGTPKGVIVRDCNLAANLQLIRERLRVSERDRLVSWLPPYHDMGLLAGVFLPLFCSAPAMILRTSDFAREPLRWLRAIHDFRASFALASNFAFDLCTARVPSAARAELDLSCLRLLISGAEPIRAGSVHAFLDTFAACGIRANQFVAGYGLAEATLLVSARDPACDPLRVLRVDRVALARGVVQLSDAREAAVFVSCGRPGPGVSVQVVDPERLEPLSEGRVGEIWTGGPSVCDGYWSDRAPSNLVAAQDAAWLRTGDLGFLHAGEVFVTGRIKDLIIAHGVNHHAEDLEAAVETAHPALRAGRCIAFELDGEARARLVIGAELGNSVAAAADPVCDAISASLRRTHALVPDEIALLRRGALIRTTSGKLARASCRAAYARGELAVQHRWLRGAP